MRLPTHMRVLGSARARLLSEERTSEGLGAVLSLLGGLASGVPAVALLVGLLFWTEGTVWMWFSTGLWLFVLLPLYIVYVGAPMVEKVLERCEL